MQYPEVVCNGVDFDERHQVSDLVLLADALKRYQDRHEARVRRERTRCLEAARWREQQEAERVGEAVATTDGVTPPAAAAVTQAGGGGAPDGDAGDDAPGSAVK